MSGLQISGAPSLVTPTSSSCGRRLKIHEYQGKQLLRSYGVQVPVGRVCESAEQADLIASAQAYCMGKNTGSTLFLAVPIGRDAVEWNLGRVYGHKLVNSRVRFRHTPDFELLSVTITYSDLVFKKLQLECAKPLFETR